MPGHRAELQKGVGSGDLLLGAHLLHLASGMSSERGQLPRLPMTQTAAGRPATHLPPTPPGLSARQHPQSPATLPVSALVPTEQPPPAHAALVGCCHLQVQVEHRVTMVPKAQAHLLMVWGEKDCFWLSERICVCTTKPVTLSGWLCLLEEDGVPHRPRRGDPAACRRGGTPRPRSLPQSRSSEDAQVRHPSPAAAPWSLAGAKCST